MPKHTSACNNLDLIRLVAATLVIFSHAYLVTAQFDQEPLHGEPYRSALTVKTFSLGVDREGNAEARIRCGAGPSGAWYRPAPLSTQT